MYNDNQRIQKLNRTSVRHCSNWSMLSAVGMNEFSSPVATDCSNELLGGISNSASRFKTDCFVLLNWSSRFV